MKFNVTSVTNAVIRRPSKKGKNTRRYILFTFKTKNLLAMTNVDKVELVRASLTHFDDLFAISEGVYQGLDYIKQVFYQFFYKYFAKSLL
jgi:hypothetical protein